jgi:Zn-dependent protease
MRLGSILGTTIEAEVTFLILMAFFVITAYNPKTGWPYAMLWIIVIFVGVLLHELAHAAMSGIFGFGPSRIVLGGMGGVTINERQQARPWQQVIISVAGPLASFGIWWGARWLYWTVPAVQHDPMLAALMPILSYANFLWGEFNLLPVSPLDGGQVLRNLLRMFLSERAAFMISVWVAMLAGTGVGIWGFFTGYVFMGILMLFLVRANFIQWQLFRAYRRPGE